MGFRKNYVFQLVHTSFLPGISHNLLQKYRLLMICHGTSHSFWSGRSSPLSLSKTKKLLWSSNFVFRCRYCKRDESIMVWLDLTNFSLQPYSSTLISYCQGRNWKFSNFFIFVSSYLPKGGLSSCFCRLSAVPSTDADFLGSCRTT